VCNPDQVECVAAVLHVLHERRQLWVLGRIFAVEVEPVHLLVPSAAGALMGVVQVDLWMIYRRSGGVESKQVQDAPVWSSRLGDPFVIEMSNSHRNTLDRIPSYLSTGGGVFIELATPRKEESIP
jgi:hypothetical protein